MDAGPSKPETSAQVPSSASPGENLVVSNNGHKTHYILTPAHRAVHRRSRPASPFNPLDQRPSDKIDLEVLLEPQITLDTISTNASSRSSGHGSVYESGTTSPVARQDRSHEAESGQREQMRIMQDPISLGLLTHTQAERLFGLSVDVALSAEGPIANPTDGYTASLVRQVSRQDESDHPSTGPDL